MCHPEYLPGILSWDQMRDWQAYYNAEPWGELRADQRAQMQTMWLKSAVSFDAQNLPETSYPYFVQEDDFETQRQKIEAMKREILQRRETAAGLVAG